MPEKRKIKVISLAIIDNKFCEGDDIGSAFYSEGNPDWSGENCMRLNFSGLTEDVIRENIKKLGNFFKSKL